MTNVVCVLRDDSDWGDDRAVRCACGVAYGWTDSPEADYSPDCPQHRAAAAEARPTPYAGDAEPPF